MKTYKVISCVSEDGRKGWKIVDAKAYDKLGLEHVYMLGGGTKFMVYYSYEDAMRDCEHLNGGSRVVGCITQGNWDILRQILKGWVK